MKYIVTSMTNGPIPRDAIDAGTYTFLRDKTLAIPLDYITLMGLLPFGFRCSVDYPSPLWP